MEAAAKNLTPAKPQQANQMFAAFFSAQTPQFATDILWHLFKAWAGQPENKKQHSNQEMALFLDQLIDLVVAASQLHQTNRVTVTPPEGAPHD